MEENARKLVETLWPLSSRKPRMTNGEAMKDLNCEAYSAYYKRQVVSMVPSTGTFDAAAYPHVKILELARQFRDDPDRNREDALTSLESEAPGLSDKTCEILIDLSARLLLMLKIGIVKNQLLPRGHLKWTRGPLPDLVQDKFPPCPESSYESIRLPKLFNAWSVAVVAGIDIGFTDNMAEHLMLVDDDSKLLIFHHASFLELQQESMFPDGFLEETIRTLALLFPQAVFSSSGRRTITRGSKQKWFQALSHKHKDLIIDSRLVLCGNLKAEDRQIRHFKFWRERLGILKQAYDEATPRTFSQWWHDGRDGVQWSTFWVAILVLIITTLLGIIQCVEGALQVYKSFN